MQIPKGRGGKTGRVNGETMGKGKCTKEHGQGKTGKETQILEGKGWGNGEGNGGNGGENERENANTIRERVGKQGGETDGETRGGENGEGKRS